MSLLLQAARTHRKNICRHCLHTPEFESSIWLLCGNWKNNDKLYYSINLPSGKWIIFFDTVHNSVWARSWRQNNRIALKVWGHFVWITVFSVHYISCQKLKFEFYTDRSPETLYTNAETLKKYPNLQLKSCSIGRWFSGKNCQCTTRELLQWTQCVKCFPHQTALLHYQCPSWNKTASRSSTHFHVCSIPIPVRDNTPH